MTDFPAFHADSKQKRSDLARASLETGLLLDGVLGFGDGGGRMLGKIGHHLVAIRIELARLSFVIELTSSLDAAECILFQPGDQGVFRDGA